MLRASRRESPAFRTQIGAAVAFAWAKEAVEQTASRSYDEQPQTLGTTRRQTRPTPRRSRSRSLEPNSASGSKKCGPFKKDLVVKSRRLDVPRFSRPTTEGEHAPLKMEEKNSHQAEAISTTWRASRGREVSSTRKQWTRLVVDQDKREEVRDASPAFARPCLLGSRPHPSLFLFLLVLLPETVLSPVSVGGRAS